MDREPNGKDVTLNKSDTYAGLKDQLAEAKRKQTTAADRNTSGASTLLAPQSTGRTNALSPHNRQNSTQVELERGQNEEDFGNFANVTQATHR